MAHRFGCRQAEEDKRAQRAAARAHQEAREQEEARREQEEEAAVHQREMREREMTRAAKLQELEETAAAAAEAQAAVCRPPAPHTHYCKPCVRRRRRWFVVLTHTVSHISLANHTLLNPPNPSHRFGSGSSSGRTPTK
jgi:hypothetical protein